MLTPWFITGFAEGEGAFTYSRNGDNLNLYFALKLNEEDSSLVNNIFDFFQVGKIYKVKPRSPSNKSGYTKPAVYYRVTRIAELEQIVRHFDRFPLQGKKAKTYKVWREMFCIKRKFRKPDIYQLNELARELTNLSSKNTFLKNINVQTV